MSKKVILIIVEGHTEEEVFYDFLQERYNNEEIRIDVQKGDILSDWNNHNINKKVGKIIKQYLTKYRLLPQDLLAVVHFTDTDGCFIPKDGVVISPQHTENLTYSNEAIYVVDEDKKQKIEQRNKLKAINVKKLAENEIFSINRIKIPYSIFYFSTNLDHLLWNERNEFRDEKMERAEFFMKNLKIPLEQFLRQFSKIEENFSYREKLTLSWEYVMERYNSLQRCTNVPLMFDMIDRVRK
ncbi:hypothetical protein [Lysinibacillus sp. 54212]|uniref:hypothetical protein n=1 Tax=Lysinibacillus sp. 54212 TaxID=3119829 RepID=UPI002FC88990